MLLDTGSALSALEMDQVVQMDLPQFDAGMTMTVITGESSSLATSADNFTLGGITRDEMRFMILPGFDYRLSENEPVGFLGLDFFSDFDLEIDFQNGDIRLFSPNDCSDPAYRWPNRHAAAIPFEGGNAQFITIAVLLDDIEVPAIIDTGAAYTVLNLDTAAGRFGIDVTKPDTRMIGMDRTDFIRTYQWQFSELNIGGILFENPQITLFPNLVRGTGRTNLEGEQLSLSEMIIGMDILRALHLYFSFSEGKVYALAEGGVEAP
nr:MAG: hypothetical protein E4H34_06415 [Hyphomicrobiales bacterium]